MPYRYFYICRAILIRLLIFFTQFRSDMRQILKIPAIALFLICRLAVAQTPSGKPSFLPKEEALYFADTARTFENATELGVALGSFRYFGDLSADGLSNTKGLKPAGGIFIRRHLIPQLALRGNLLLGKISAQDRDYTDPTWRQARNYKFSTNVTEFSVQAEWDILGKKRFRRTDTIIYELDRYRQIAHVHKFKTIPAPYVFVGGGYVFSKATTTFDQNYLESAGLAAQAAEDIRKGGEKQGNASLTFGAGVNLDLGRSWLIGLEAGARPGFSDYLDGVSVSGNPDKPDWYWFAGLNVALRLGKKDSDGDGIADKSDKCPDIPGFGRTHGCPDADHDGIADMDDQCPHRKGVVELGGCPIKDVDNDSIPDVDDQCPTVPGLAKFFGCPDTDNDGIEDRQDSCATIAGLPQFHGCPDTDGDGIEDKLDACPTEKGPWEYYYGCPVRDTDRDSVEDKLDACLLVPGKVEFRGCPDTDNDGVEDALDVCPTLAGLKENKGCPTVEKKDKEKLDLAVKAVKFQTGKAVLLKQSNKILTDIANILAKYPFYNLSIEGHTDNVGNDKKNLILSEKRAQACMDFLITKGVSRSRLSSKGFGETKPVADNKTAAGRTKNRRVEFNLVLVGKG